MAQNRKFSRGFPRNEGGIPPITVNSGIPRQQPQSRRGRPRDYARMHSYNMNQGPQNWASVAEVDNRFTEAIGFMPPIHRNRPKQQKTREPSNLMQKSTEPSAPTNELLYEGEFGGSFPNRHTYSHNLDFSGFVLLTEEVYNLMEVTDSHLRRQLPFCLFQHAMFEILNAYLVHIVKTQNEDERFEEISDPFSAIGADGIFLPQPIVDYLIGIGELVISTGDKIKFNLPNIAIPGKPDDEGDGGGYFGPVTADTHNVYESYCSPYISRKLIERTIQANTAARNARGQFDDWNPFTVGLES